MREDREDDLLPLERFQARIQTAVDEAIQRGDFDNLPGKGKPLRLDRRQPNDDWLANKILKNANYVPPWVELQQELAKLEAKAEQLATAWLAQPTEANLSALTVAWEDVNALIRKYNAAVPNPSLQRYPKPVERRLAQLREQKRVP